MDESEGIICLEHEDEGVICLEHESEGPSACNIKVTHEGSSAWNMKRVMGWGVRGVYPLVDGGSTH